MSTRVPLSRAKPYPPEAEKAGRRSRSPVLRARVNATKVGNFWSTLLLMNQNLDQILGYNESPGPRIRSGKL